MYVILINDDNSMIATERQRIVQRSKLFDTFWFLVRPDYNGYDMSACTVLLEYLKPVSREYRTEILTLSKDKYEGYLKYLLPVDTQFTREAGELEMKLSFLFTDLDINGKPIIRVRKIEPALPVTIVPCSAWSDIVPDEALTVIDQRIIKTDAQIRALEEMSVLLDMTKADNLRYDKATSELQLMSGEDPVGDIVTLQSIQIDGATIDDVINESIKEGVPVVEFGSGDSDTEDKESEVDNVVEF